MPTTTYEAVTNQKRPRGNSCRSLAEYLNSHKRRAKASRRKWTSLKVKGERPSGLIKDVRLCKHWKLYSISFFIYLYRARKTMKNTELKLKWSFVPRIVYMYSHSFIRAEEKKVFRLFCIWCLCKNWRDVLSELLMKLTRYWIWIPSVLNLPLKG